MAKERFRKSYRHKVLDDRLTKQRTLADARCSRRMRRVGVMTPHILLTDVAAGLVVMERVPGRTAKQFLLDAAASGDDAAQLATAAAIGDVVARVHAGGLVHGDLTTSNMIVNEPAAAEPGATGASSASGAVALSSAVLGSGSGGKDRVSLTLIDFGLSQQCKGSQLDDERGVDLYVMERAFLSTHADSQHVFDAVMAAYRSSAAWGEGTGPGSAASLGRTMAHLDTVRARGRKRLAFG